MRDILVFLLIDFVGFSMVDDFSKAMPGYGTYGWPLYIAMNAGAVFYFRNKYFK